ncbi:hypothetical protein GCM10023238_29690 [Streptomyces heliomycini]
MNRRVRRWAAVPRSPTHPAPTLKGRPQVHFDGVVKAVSRTPIVLATDASVAGDKVGTGYLATTGETGLRAQRLPAAPHRTPRPASSSPNSGPCTGDCGGSSRRIPAGPSRCASTTSTPMDLLHEWQGGGYRMPDGYETRLRSQGAPAQPAKLPMYAEYTPGLTFVHEKAHVAQPAQRGRRLSLAKLGLRSCAAGIPATEIPRLVPLWASGALAEYRHGRG